MLQGDGQKVFSYESLLDVVYIKFCLIAYIVLINPFTTDLHFLISCIPVSANRFTAFLITVISFFYFLSII